MYRKLGLHMAMVMCLGVLCNQLSAQTMTWEEFSRQMTSAFRRGDVEELNRLRMHSGVQGFGNLNDLSGPFYRYGSSLDGWDQMLRDAQANAVPANAPLATSDARLPAATGDVSRNSRLPVVTGDTQRNLDLPAATGDRQAGNRRTTPPTSPTPERDALITQPRTTPPLARANSIAPVVSDAQAAYDLRNTHFAVLTQSRKLQELAQRFPRGSRQHDTLASIANVLHSAGSDLELTIMFFDSGNFRDTQMAPEDRGSAGYERIVERNTTPHPSVSDRLADYRARNP